MTEKKNTLQEKINLYLSIVVLVLFVLVPPIACGLLYLSRVPDITWEGEDNRSYTRIWMYRERRPLGIAQEKRSVVEHYSDSEVCIETSLSFLLWGKSDKATPITNRHIMIFLNNRWQFNGEPCPLRAG